MRLNRFTDDFIFDQNHPWHHIWCTTVKVICLAAVSVGLTAGLSCRGVDAVSLPAIFSDSMVLQADQTLPVFGTAAPGETIKVTLAGKTESTTADARGRWRVNFEPIAPGGPHALTVAGKNTVSFSNILLGDVWLLKLRTVNVARRQAHPRPERQH